MIVTTLELNYLGQVIALKGKFVKSKQVIIMTLEEQTILKENQELLELKRLIKKYPYTTKYYINDLGY